MISALGESCAAGTADKVAEVEAASRRRLHVFDAPPSRWTVSTWIPNDQSYGFVGTQLIWTAISMNRSRFRTSVRYSHRRITELN
jgi:hypothetical protein